MYVRAQRQRLRGDLVPHVVNSCKDIRDQETGKTAAGIPGPDIPLPQGLQVVSSGVRRLDLPTSLGASITQSCVTGCIV